MVSEHAIWIAVAVAVIGALIGALIGVLSNWIEKPARLSSSLAVSFLAVGIVTLVFLTLYQTGAFSHARGNTSAPAGSPTLKASPGPHARRTTGTPHARQTRSPSPATGQSSRPPQPATSAPAGDPADEVLSARMSPDEIQDDGQDVAVRVTVTNATPGGQVTWEEDAHGPGNYPGQTP